MGLCEGDAFGDANNQYSIDGRSHPKGASYAQDFVDFAEDRPDFSNRTRARRPGRQAGRNPPAWAWPSRGASSARTAGPSASTARSAPAPPFGSSCPSPNPGSETGRRRPALAAGKRELEAVSADASATVGSPRARPFTRIPTINRIPVDCPDSDLRGRLRSVADVRPPMSPILARLRRNRRSISHKEAQERTKNRIQFSCLFVAKLPIRALWRDRGKPSAKCRVLGGSFAAGLQIANYVTNASAAPAAL